MKAEEIIDKYYGEEPELKELLLMHSRQVADKAMFFRVVRASFAMPS